MIKWRPATQDDIGMPCRFFDIDPDGPVKQHPQFGILQCVASGFLCHYPDETSGEFFKFAEVAERFTPIEDPILDVRVAVADALDFWLNDSRHIHGSINKSVVAKLPAYFRQKLYTEGS